MCDKKGDSGDRFSSIEEEFLIELVSNHEELWKLSHKDFKNNSKKDAIWNSIGEKLQKTGKLIYPAIIYLTILLIGNLIVLSF
jgi:hypothetical protein